MNAIELFAGAGGLGLGLSQAGIHVALANEIEPDFARTYALNHPNTQVINQDIHQINWENIQQELPLIDLIVGGPPCQGFSTLGSKNQQDPRNSLLHEYLRCVTIIKPRYILFENVAGFMRLYEGTSYKTLMHELNKLGYACHTAILEASNYGLPQKRQRTIIVGWKKNLHPIPFPSHTHTIQPSLLEQNSKLTLWEAISDLPSIGHHDAAHHYLTPPQNFYQQSMRQDCHVLTEHNSTNYGEKMQQILALVPQGGSVEDLPLNLRPKSYFKNTYARLLPNECSPTITRNFGTPSSSRCIHPFQNRALSTREGARLQGFPDNYIFYGGKGSKNLQIGNAVPPLFGKLIAQEILSHA